MTRCCLLVSALVASLALPAPAGGARRRLDRVVAVVNAEIVLESEIDSTLLREPLLQEELATLGANPAPEVVSQKRAEVRSKVLDSLVDNVLIRQEAERFQITASEEDVERYSNQIATSNGMKDVAELKAAVDGDGKYGTWEEYKAILAQDILVLKTTQSLASWTVTDAQVREHYRKMTRGEAAKVEVERFTLMPPSQDPRDRDRVFSAAQVAARRLRAGEDTPTVAASIDQESPSPKLIGRGDIAPALEEALFSAKPGEIVGPLQSGQGYVVFKVMRHQASDVLDFEQAKDRIRTQLETEAIVKAEADFKQQLRAKAHLDIRL